MTDTADRPPLNPAAQAVLDAANGASSWGPDDCLNDAREIAAAALRALADHQQAPITLGQPIDHWNPDERTRRELRNLAAELADHG